MVELFQSVTTLFSYDITSNGKMDYFMNKINETVTGGNIYMDKISKGFVGRTVRAVLFIILIIVFCTAISSAGIYLASRYGLTQSREQVPLTALYLGNEGKVELPGRGKMAEGNGWRLRNSRDSYTLTLDNAVIENTVMKNISMENTVMENAESSRPAIDITGDLTIELKEGSGSWIRSEGAGIRIHSGTWSSGEREAWTLKPKQQAYWGTGRKTARQPCAWRADSWI